MFRYVQKFFRPFIQDSLCGLKISIIAFIVPSIVHIDSEKIKLVFHFAFQKADAYSFYRTCFSYSHYATIMPLICEK